MTQDEEVFTEWDLTVASPMLSLGETQSYYDGLDLIVDAHPRIGNGWWWCQYPLRTPT